MFNIKFKDSPFKVILFIYLSFMFVFSFLYYMPFSQEKPISFVDALFLSSSGMSVTGLTTFTIIDKLTYIGQFILFIQIQIGGIGIMAILGSLLFVFKRNVSLPHQALMSFDQNQKSLKSIKKLMIFIVSYTFVVEFLGFVFFYFLLKSHILDNSQLIFTSMFHSAASFTGAGFDLFGNSLLNFSSDFTFIIITAILIFLGSVGFPTVLELLFSKNKKKSLFTKVNLIVHFSLLAIGFLLFLLFEFSNQFSEMPFIDKISNALFLSVTARNGGLTTVDIGTVLPSTLIFLLFLMFIGGSASSCAGGIRTTTFGVIIAKIVSIIRGREDVVLFKKSLHYEDVNKAFVVVAFFFSLFFFSTMILSFVEGMDMDVISFEVMSAITTTGLSTGITDQLTPFSKIWLSSLMVIGRLGVFVLIYSIIHPKKSSVNYVKEHIIVG